MSVQQLPSASAAGLDDALEHIAGRAGELDAAPRFPTENFADLAAAGALTPPAGGLAAETNLVRAVAAADGSTARILDGHLNGVERLALLAPEPLRSEELSAVRDGSLLLGVWGADPAAGEGSPAELRARGEELVLGGVKTFCSGAGGVQRALVLARDADGARRLVYLDPRISSSVDRRWYRASGLRSSESHRVEFHDTPVMALLGGPGELSREPWFSRDAVRTSGTWAGLADRVVSETIGALDPERADQVQAHGLGTMLIAQQTIGLWLDHATRSLDSADEQARSSAPSVLAAGCRAALCEAALLISAQAARVCGSRALVGASDLDRVRRDLDLFLLQHRIDPKIAKLGADALGEPGS
jgi:alkylation response protein AidB-like acyl-CoA dehydrogenase